MGVNGWDVTGGAEKIKEGLCKVAEAIKYHADAQVKIAEMEAANPPLAESEWIGKS
jgi:hypothetical protein